MAKSRKLTHLNERGEARMVDVGAKEITARSATAEAVIRMERATHDAVMHGSGPKGEVLGTARVAGIMAAKRTPEAIPMCHPLGISGVEIEFDTAVKPVGGRHAIAVRATVRCTGKTGVEMEALHAASIAALTIYDMVKALEKGMVIESVRLLEKSGGKTGDYKA